MHQLSPAVERAAAAARHWAARLGSDAVRLAHFVLALLEEEEGRPATLLEAVGVAPGRVREKLEHFVDSPVAPADGVLFAAARDWSLAVRHDPEVLTDALLLAVLRAEPDFERTAATFGLDARRLEERLTGVTGSGAHDTPPARPDEPAVDRVLDANFNRAREAARVLDDYCRFVLDDRVLTAEVKELRHALAATEGRLPAARRLAARDTPGDVGTSVTAGGEYDRSTPAQVALVNLKRLQEALRSLEEFGKLLGDELGRELEALRYRAYSLEQPLAIGTRARERLAGVNLYLLVSEAGCTGPLEWTIARAAEGGVGAVQLREKGLSDRELLSRARDVRRWTRAAGVLFVVNDRPDVARLAEADGVHLGQDDLSISAARRIVGPDLLVGVSTHTVEQVRRAVMEGADYLGVGPVFPSTTKAFGELAGLDFVRAAATETSLPFFALGGVTPENAGLVAGAGARRLAVAAAVARAGDPAAAARDLLAALKQPG